MEATGELPNINKLTSVIDDTETDPATISTLPARTMSSALVMGNSCCFRTFLALKLKQN